MSKLSYALYIDGLWSASDGDVTIDVINPATEAVIGRVPQATPTDVHRAIDAARRAFDDGPWPRMSVRERARIMVRMADEMDRRFNELVRLNMAETGSVRAIAETGQIGTPIEHFRDMAERIMPQFPFETPAMPTMMGGASSQGMSLREPFGVVALITAYNFPFFLNIMKLAPALAAGCTTVLKPAPTTPLQAFIIAEIAEEAGLPPGVLNIVTGDILAGQTLTSSSLIDLVSFTGSDAVGRQIYAQAAPALTKVVLELGGKSAHIICDDADVTKAVPSIVGGITVNAGQGCALLTRTFVHESRHTELVDAVVKELKKVRVGDPANPDTTMGPLISAAQRATVENLIAVGVKEGATLKFGGGRPPGLDSGFFVEPTLFTDVSNDMTIAQEEFFGPVGVIIPFSSDDEAIELANDSRYGLGGGVRAKDPARAYAIAKRLRTGMVKVNGGAGGVTPHSSFGGYKDSGLGREWGSQGLEEFLQTKTVEWRLAEA